MVSSVRRRLAERVGKARVPRGRSSLRLESVQVGTSARPVASAGRLLTKQSLGGQTYVIDNERGDDTIVYGFKLLPPCLDPEQVLSVGPSHAAHSLE